MESELHVAIIAFPFGSHTTGMLDIAKLLTEAKPNLTISFLSTAKSNSSLFSRSSSNSNIKPIDVYDGVPEGHVFSGDIEEGINLFLAAAPRSFLDGIRVAEAETGRRVSCLLADAMSWFCSDLAAEIGVPVIPCWTTAACSLSTHLNTDLIADTVNGQPFTFIPGMEKVCIDDLPAEFFSGNLTTTFTKLIRKMGLELPNVPTVVVYSFEAWEPLLAQYLKSSLKQVLFVGPSITDDSTYSDESGCLKWLDRWGPGKVVYVAFGSAAMLLPDEILALANALEERRLPFIWSLKDEGKRHLPNGFVERTKENGKFISWAPQVHVLKHASVGAFVMHGGWMSTIESIIGEVPMICRSFFGDQTINSRMIDSVWEIGVKIPSGSFTKTVVGDALDRIFSSDGDKMRKNVGHLKDEAIKALKPNGSSNEDFKTLVEIIIK